MLTSANDAKESVLMSCESSYITITNTIQLVIISANHVRFSGLPERRSSTGFVITLEVGVAGNLSSGNVDFT
jgi:hypothetical protein